MLGDLWTKALMNFERQLAADFQSRFWGGARNCIQVRDESFVRLRRICIFGDDGTSLI